MFILENPLKFIPSLQVALTQDIKVVHRNQNRPDIFDLKKYQMKFRILVCKGITCIHRG
jgi:hypothetical protein